MSERSRRAVLAALGGSVTLTGCTQPGHQSETDGSSVTATATGPFERITVKGESLVIELADVAELDAVNVIAPDGSEFASREVATGASRVEVNLGLNYSVGEYRILALKQDGVTAEQDFEINPDIRISDFGIGLNTPEMMPEGLGSLRTQEAWVEIENRGSGPVVIEKVLLLGGVPNPTDDLKAASEENSISGIFDTEQGQGEVDWVAIRPGETLTLFTNSLPFSFQGDGVDCPTTSTTHEFRVELVTRPSVEVQKRFGATYEREPNADRCRISVIAR